MLLGVKRIYEKASMTDGKRILVDRLWPRGVRKSTSNIDYWMKDVAPSEELRRWFHKNPRKWTIFKKKYAAEIKNNSSVKNLAEKIAREDATLVYASSDTRHNNAVALAAILKPYIAKAEKALREKGDRNGQNGRYREMQTQQTVNPMVFFIEEMWDT